MARPGSRARKGSSASNPVSRSRCRPIVCMRFGWSATGRSSPSASTPRASGSSTTWTRPRAEPFPSTLRHGTLDRSCNQGDQAMAISRFDLTQPPGPRMSRCVVRDNTVYLAGLTASDATQDIKGQTKQILDKIDGYLAQAGTSKSNLLSANLWIKDMALFADMNSVWNAWVDPENPPARACVKADLARPDLLVEIMVTAAK